MPILTPVLYPGEPDPALIPKLEVVKQICLAMVASVAIVNLAGSLIPALGRIFPNGWQLMEAGSAPAALFSALSLQLSEPRRSPWMHRIGLLLAIAVTLLATLILIGYGLHISLGAAPLLGSDRGSATAFSGRMSPQTAAAFALLGISTMLVPARRRLSSGVADLLVLCLCPLVMVLVLGSVFGATGMFGVTAASQTSPQTLLCLLLLTPVAVFLRTEDGIFAIFVGSGIGSRIARIVTPILLAMPLLRELGRAHMIHVLRIPEHYATAILASLATTLSFALILVFAWRINTMEMEIHDLSLRDHLTGLYNVRGFYLLAVQALRLAQRSQLPFSVLFVVLDNLKQINETLGHEAGSALLVETAEILKTTFREADVMGQIGGNEFAVAGEFTYMAISIAAQQLKAACALRNSQPGLSFPLSFSIGYVTAEQHIRQSLKELLAQAGNAIGEPSGRKKLSRD
jgi:diguanylate cyclase (GGDEF)-like protein